MSEKSLLPRREVWSTEWEWWMNSAKCNTVCVFLLHTILKYSLLMIVPQILSRKCWSKVKITPNANSSSEHGCTISMCNRPILVFALHRKHSSAVGTLLTNCLNKPRDVLPPLLYPCTATKSCWDCSTVLWEGCLLVPGCSETILFKALLGPLALASYWLTLTS